MRVIIAASRVQADEFCRARGWRCDPRYQTRDAFVVTATNPRVVEGVRPSEIHILPGARDYREWPAMEQVLLRHCAKSPTPVPWFDEVDAR